MEPRMKGKGLNLTVNIPDYPVEVSGNQNQLKEVFFNLLENALNYTPSGGSVSLTLLPRQEETLVEVADTGIGIPAEEQEKIFERFYRVDKARSRDQGGTGLGLAIVKEIVASFGGMVWVESAEGQGSRFYVAFPVNIKEF